MTEPVTWVLPQYFVWVGILFCITQSAIFSGLNLACFSISRLRLEIEAANGNVAAEKVLDLRRDSNLLLATVLWGNVAINVLLTILSNSVMFGVASFLFSTFVITICGEILPQAYFSRHALKMASLLKPVLRFYQRLLYPVTRPTATLLDFWIGKESVHFMREKDLRQLIHRHIDASESELDVIEGIGALNFLAIDDLRVVEEGERLAPETILTLSGHLDTDNGGPTATGIGKEDLVARIRQTSYRWFILTRDDGTPAWALDSHALLRAINMDDSEPDDLGPYCHRPFVISDQQIRLGEVIAQFKSGQPAQSDAPFPRRIILYWGEEKRIITGSDIMGRLFKGIGVYSRAV